LARAGRTEERTGTESLSVNVGVTVGAAVGATVGVTVGAAVGATLAVAQASPAQTGLRIETEYPT